MKNTKELILETSLHLFNTHGLSKVSLRTIANEMGISQGNLSYHFKKREAIIEVLYFQLVSLIDAEMEQMAKSESVLQMLFDSSKISIRCLYNYRFFMRDLYIIMKENKKIHEHYIQLQELRKVQFTQVFDGLIALGIMRGEEFENEYRRLYLRMNILGDNWINAQELLQEKVEDPLIHYQSLLFEVIYPYLTKKGKLLYFEITTV